MQLQDFLTTQTLSPAVTQAFSIWLAIRTFLTGQMSRRLKVEVSVFVVVGILLSGWAIWSGAAQVAEGRLTTQTAAAAKNELDEILDKVAPNTTHQQALAQVIATLEAAQAERVLTDAQQTLLVDGLKRIGPGQINIIAQAGDNEARHFATRLHDTFQLGGWSAGEVREMTQSPALVGLELAVHDRTSAPVFAEPLADLFLRLKLSHLEILVDQSVAEGQLSLFIGAKS